MKYKNAIRFENNFNKLSASILDAIDKVRFFDLSACNIDDSAQQELLTILETIFESLDNYPSVEVLKDILDIKEIIKYDKSIE